MPDKTTLKPRLSSAGSSLLLPFLALIFIFTLNSSLFSYQDTKTRIFKEVDNLLAQATEEKADLLSPENYKKAVEKHEAALKSFDKGKNVQKKLAELKKLLEKVIETSRLAQISFSHLLKARDDAIEANAIEFAKETFEKAEKIFNDAARTFEKNSIDKAREKAIRAEKIYREAELTAIKENIIGNVKELLKQAEDQKVHKYAPETIKRSRALLAEAEAILTSNRSAKNDAKEKAELAEYEAKHAIYLADQIKVLREDDLNWEKLILHTEEYFADILKLLGYAPKFDTGFDAPTESALKGILSLKQQNRELSAEIASLDKKIEELEDAQNQLQAKLSSLKEKEAGLKAQLTLEEKQKEKFRKIESMFSKDEAKIFREGDQIRIRLLGIKFPSGKAVIQPEYFSLLTKLQRAIRLFPDYHITVEGHTDNKGDQRTNQSLSLRRASSVMSYLVANMGLSPNQISALGYGESQPIASNETKQGRAKNRRIDIVLSPVSQ